MRRTILLLAAMLLTLLLASGVALSQSVPEGEEATINHRSALPIHRMSLLAVLLLTRSLD
jgi:hypothetical protein